MPECTHLDQVLVPRPDQVEGCEDCLRMGGWWVHLRVCRKCGHIGCCDNSPHRHATVHAHATDHAIITSVEPGEDWSYCYPDDLMLVLEEAR
jgi:hypothetical protein